MNAKTVWLFNHYAQEPSGSGGTRHFSLAKYLRELGWNMKIIAASVDHFDGRQRLDDDESYRQDELERVCFVWLKTPRYSGNGYLRVLNMLIYTARAYFGRWKLAVDKPDVIVGSSVHPFAVVVAALLAKKYSVPFVFEVRDLWPETLVAMGRWPEKSWKTKLFRLLETWLYKRAEKIITLLPFADEYIHSLGIDNNKVVWVSNGVDLVAKPESHSVKDKECFSLMYFGALGQANGLENLLSAMHIVQQEYVDEKIELRLVGDGARKSALIEQARDLKLKNVFFEKSVAKNKIPDLAAQADAFVICVKNLPRLYRFGISMNKIFDYMAASRPVIIASNARNNPVLEAGAGISVEADNSKELANAIIKMIRFSPGERNVMGMRGRNYVENKFDYKILSKVFSNVLDSVLDSS